MDQANPAQHDAWTDGEAYERYVGRWSRPVAREFLAWLKVPAGCSWLDVGCGAGALTKAILEDAHPEHVLGVEPAESFLANARARIRDDRAAFARGSGGDIPAASATFDAVVSGLVLNFIADLEDALAEMRRVGKVGGTLAAYVWDYAEGAQFIRAFWAAALELDPSATAFDEGRRFPLCQPEPLKNAFERAGLVEVAVRAIVTPTRFKNFDDYWLPFTAGVGPAPGYVASLGEAERKRLREQLRSTLPVAEDASIPLFARAWAVRGTVPD